MQDSEARVDEAAATLGASIVDRGELTAWGIAMAGKHIGDIRYEPRAGIWLATSGIESTIGDLVGCLRFVIRRN
jgi:hypothetical protein